MLAGASTGQNFSTTLRAMMAKPELTHLVNLSLNASILGFGYAGKRFASLSRDPYRSKFASILF
jgi:hypothetical protein